ncbi:MAG: hypothetical protein OFPII_31420 [Osedax symbiont Rs1]|nr:MAG: hypothetical protein OFPII_31420 [Osedax symbiont Rs1]
MRWNLDQLQAFISTVQQGSFSSAARKLNRAQSGVSTAIANLETDIGFELFDRGQRYPILTEKGRCLYPQALKLLQQGQHLQAQINTLASASETAITLAMDEAFPETALDKALQEIEHFFPYFTLTLINGTQGDIVDYVSNGQADLGLLVQHDPVDEALYAIEIGHLNYQLVVAKDHPLTALEEVSVLDLQQYRQYVSCNKQGVAYNRPISANCWYLDSYYYILPLVTQGGGWAIIPKNIVEQPLFGRDLTELKVKEFSSPPASTISIIKKRSSANGTVSQQLIEYLRKHFSS